MIKMSNLNITQCGTRATGLCVMIGRCSPETQHGRFDRHLANVGVSLFRYMNDEPRNHTNQRRKRKTWTKEDNQLALHCYFWSNPTLRGYRKRTIEIWQKYVSFQTTSRRLADQVRTIIKKCWFSDLEILEIRQKTINEPDTNTVSETLGFDKQEQANRNKRPTS